MKTALDDVDVERFRNLVARHFGLAFDESRTGFLEDVLRRRIAANNIRPAEYLSSIEFPGAAKRECQALGTELTVGETYFFRNPDQFNALGAMAVPTCLRGQNKTLRILSAGCASGEEAYSIAILLRMTVPNLDAYRIVIHGIDINTASLEKARRGRYSSWSLRETPADIRERWFCIDGKEFVLDDSIKNMPVFKEGNLMDSASIQGDVYDIIFCRNVLMYFMPDHTRAIVARLARRLAPSGFLFLGHAETLRGLSQDFDLRHTHNTFYYQRKNVLDETSDVSSDAVSASVHTLAEPFLPIALKSEDAWVENIQRASERITRLADGRHKPIGRRTATSVAPLREPVAWDLGSAMDLFRQERFAEALTLMHGLPTESETDPDVLLLRAVLHIHNGELHAAEHVCVKLIHLDSMNAGAHYLMALCFEHAGDLQTATNHDRMAAYLDSTFAMPRVHLGLLFRKQGNLAAAHREFSQARVLLQREDLSRLLFFGGGFGREALLAICTSEIAACGDQR